MAKTLITDSIENDNIPFLRGIITRSLRKAGMSFDDAYALSSDLRDQLEGVAELSSSKLRKMVVKMLPRYASDDVVKRYQAYRSKRPLILVQGLDEQLRPYSNEHLRRGLIPLGLDQQSIRIFVKKIYHHLAKSGCKQIHVNKLGLLVHQCMCQDRLLGPDVAARYLTWTNFSRSGHPLILLIGGTAGSGKSTISNALASSLDIVRTQSTDMLREVMRMLIPDRILPVLHESSFAAWKSLPMGHSDVSNDPTALLIAGYRTQAELLSVPCEAVIHRTLQENISLVLEGVHVAAPLLRTVPDDKLAVVVHIMLAVLKKKELKNRLERRNKTAPDRCAKDFPASFADIWRLQSFLLDEADQAEVPIVVNEDKKETIREIMIIVINSLSKDYSCTAEDIFGEALPEILPTEQAHG